MQTYTDGRRRTRTDADWHGHRRTHADSADVQIFQLHSLSKLLYVWALSLPPPHHSLPHVGSFSRSKNTVGTQSIVSETPPTNLQCSELAYPWETLLDSWICLLSGLGRTMVFISCRLTQTYADACRRTQTHADEHKANCVWCVGGRNLKTCPDVRRSRTFGMYYTCYSEEDEGKHQNVLRIQTYSHPAWLLLVSVYILNWSLISGQECNYLLLSAVLCKHWALILFQLRFTVSGTDTWGLYSAEYWTQDSWTTS